VRWPGAEIEVNAKLVEQLVREQHPDLINEVITEMSSGFDNSIWRLGDRLVVRIPRRLVAVPLIESEQRWLPELAPLLPLSIPTPIRVGRPSELFPWPWTIARWIEGAPGNLVTVSSAHYTVTHLAMLRATPSGACRSVLRMETSAPDSMTSEQ
jgi:aminoglycoside phosphotransferase (APT) family kinase protein